MRNLEQTAALNFKAHRDNYRQIVDIFLWSKFALCIDKRLFGAVQLLNDVDEIQ